MRTKVMFGRQVALSTFISTLIVVASVGTPRADVVADQSGAVLIFPKIIVDTSAVLADTPTDTLLQITNTSNSVVSARCVLVDTTPRCISVSGIPDTACTEKGEADGDRRCAVGSRCEPQWRKVSDFQFTLTKRQPIAWRASEGLPFFPCGAPVVDPNEPGGCANGASNTDADGLPSSIPVVSDDPFFGEIKCAQVDPGNSKPTVGLNDGNDRRGDLAGHGTIVSVNPVDARKYNALALQSTGFNDGDDVLQIGGEFAEYNSCPHSLIMQHLFDGADVPYTSGNDTANVVTDVTLVACSQDFNTDSTVPATLQLLVFNEFEQRFSASTRFDCWKEVQLSDLVPRPGSADDAFSLFSVNVQGSLAGQTRIRPVSSNGRSNGVLGIGEEFWAVNGSDDSASSAFQLNHIGVGELGDQIILSPIF